jgi:hypothetical protein
VTNVVFFLSSGLIFIWLCLEKPSMKEYMELHSGLSTKISICGKEKSSLGLVQIPEIHTNFDFPLFVFSTTTMLDTYYGYLTTKKPAFHCFLIFILDLIRIFGWILLNFCLTDL